MLAQAPEECRNPSWWHRGAFALQQCAPPFASPCKTGCASSRCRSRRLCLALPVRHFCQKLLSLSIIVIQSMFSRRPFGTTCLGPRCSSEVTGFSHVEARRAPVSATGLTHAVQRRAQHQQPYFWPQLRVLRISCGNLPLHCLPSIRLRFLRPVLQAVAEITWG